MFNETSYLGAYDCQTDLNQKVAQGMIPAGSPIGWSANVSQPFTAMAAQDGALAIQQALAGAGYHDVQAAQKSSIFSPHINLSVWLSPNSDMGSIDDIKSTVHGIVGSYYQTITDESVGVRGPLANPCKGVSYVPQSPTQSPVDAGYKLPAPPGTSWMDTLLGTLANADTIKWTAIGLIGVIAVKKVLK